jgi:translation elongation factor EF-1beta
MPKLTFRGAFIRFVDLRFDEKSKSTYVKINFTSDFSEPIREAMEWGEPGAGFTASDLEGELSLTHLVLTPNGRELKPHEMQISAKEATGFSVVRVKGDDGESTHNELRFQVLTADPDAAAKLREYIANIGKGVAQLRVNCEVQEEMDLGEAAEDAQERLISKEQAEDTEEADKDIPRTSPPKSHQRRKADAPGARRGAEQIPDPVLQ